MKTEAIKRVGPTAEVWSPTFRRSCVLRSEDSESKFNRRGAKNAEKKVGLCFSALFASLRFTRCGGLVAVPFRRLTPLIILSLTPLTLFAAEIPKEILLWP